MLFLPAAALCCLCSALLTMAAQLIQKDKILTRRVGEKVSFSCGGTRQCGTSVYWYQLKEKETFKYLQTISMYTIENIRPDHSATYYCACWKYASLYGTTNNHLIFGSGTKLSVTDGNQSGQKRTTQAPRVHANTRQSPTRPAGPRVHVGGNSSLLCVPPAMFPSLVQLSCKRQKKNGGLEELPPAEGEQLQLIHEQENSTYKCSCYIKDGGRTVEARTQEELPAPAASCPPEREPADLPALQPADWSFQSQCRVKLLCLLYTVLIVKSLVYCCGLSLLMILRNKGASTNCTHAD